MSYERFLAIGCTHGPHIDRKAFNAILRFKRDFKPRHVIHLGDFVDAAALRSGAKGTGDEVKPLGLDMNAGLMQLKELEPTVILCGNHEARIWRLAEHHNAIISECAGGLKAQVQRTAKELHATILPYDGIHQEWRLHGWRFMHGVFFSENATRDHAESYGNVVHAHTHRPGVSKGRRSDNPTGYCVGTLTKIRNMDYANTRRATLSWGQGFIWGEIGPRGASMNLSIGPEEGSKSEWRLP
jgi:predicted phosphodiesterase